MSYQAFIKTHAIIENHQSYTSEQLVNIRRELFDALESSDHKDKITIVATGSYGRGEASESSDIDLFILFDSDKLAEEVLSIELENIKEVIEKHVPNDSGDTGTFGMDTTLDFKSLLKNIGGKDDSNINMTRRMLFLLEGTWLYGLKRFEDYRKELLTQYTKDNSGSLERFLLNDIIRYYRTIATDFQHKVSEKNKSWGLRNLKLRFSRKILYFAGVVVIAEMVDFNGSKEERSSEIIKLLNLAALERIFDIGKDQEQTARIFEHYNNFLTQISDPEKRAELDGLTKDDRNTSAVYTAIREDSREFSRILARWLCEKYPDDHKIHNALIF